MRELQDAPGKHDVLSGLEGPSRREEAQHQEEQGSPFCRGPQQKKNAIAVKDEDEVDHIINVHRMIASLTKASDSIALCTNKIGWKKVSLAIDSGACDNVIDAEELLLDYKVHQTTASTSNMKYASATGEEISNLGEVMLPMITFEGTKKKMRVQAAAVSRPLASVTKICEGGHMVIFDDQVSYLYKKVYWRSQLFTRGVGQQTCSTSGSRQMRRGILQVRRAKARLIIEAFTDPGLFDLESHSPRLTSKGL